MKKKIVFLICCVLLMSLSNSTAVSASVKETWSVSSNGIHESDAMPYADTIVMKYRTYNGMRQYRRWNETKKYWVDPYWLNL